MDIADARTAFALIEKTRLGELKAALLQAAIRYAARRSEYALADAAAKAGLEDARTRAHNAFIDACNILSRSMAAAGEDISWRQALGDNRREIGDLAYHLQLFLAMKAR